MKVLFTLTRAFNPNTAGVQRTTYKLGRYFTEQGIEVAYFSSKTQGHVEIDFGTLFHVKEEGGMGQHNNLLHLEQVLTEWRPDIVINQMPYDRYFRDCLAQNKRKLDYVLLGCLRNSLFNFISNAKDKMEGKLPNSIFQMLNNPLGIGLVKMAHKWKHSRNLRAILDAHDYYILLAPPNQKELNFFVGDYAAEKVRVVPNSIPGVYPDALNGKKKTILYVGSLNIEQKRVNLLPGFWERAHQELPDWQLVIVGHGGYAEQLKLDFEAKALPRVSLEGFQKPESYYREAGFFVMTSAYEGFPNTILEAHSYGCPVTAFNSYAAIEWIVNDEQDALLCAPFDLEEMSAKAVNLASDPLKLQKMQSAALRNAEKFTIDKVGQQWLELFESFGERFSYRADKNAPST